MKRIEEVIEVFVRFDIGINSAISAKGLRVREACRMIPFPGMRFTAVGEESTLAFSQGI